MCGSLWVSEARGAQSAGFVFGRLDVASPKRTRLQKHIVPLNDACKFDGAFRPVSQTIDTLAQPF